MILKFGVRIGVHSNWSCPKNAIKTPLSGRSARLPPPGCRPDECDGASGRHYANLIPETLYAKAAGLESGKAAQKAAQPVTEMPCNDVKTKKTGGSQKALNPAGCCDLQQPAGLSTEWRGGESNPQQNLANPAQTEAIVTAGGAKSGALGQDLETVVNRWNSLPLAVRRAILMLVSGDDASAP